jgi:hypothetical protein
MELKGFNILITSNEPWGDVWFSKHNYANELSKHNRVVFADPTPSWRPNGVFGPHISLDQVQENLHVLRYGNVLPAVHDLPFRLNNAIVSRAIIKALHARGLKPDLFLSFDPSRLFDPSLLGAKHSAFIAVDAYSMQMRGERFIYPRMDRFITVSGSFNAFFKPYHKPILTISHGIPAEAFNAVPAPLGFRNYGIYVGTLDLRLDLGLLRGLIEDHPEVPFVFIGPYALEGHAEASQLFREGHFPNVHLLGPMPYKKLAACIAGASFCLAPMGRHFPGNNISHHKIYQYLALGKPVFSTVFSEYKPIGDLLYMHDDPRELRAALSHFLEENEPGTLAAERIAHARTRTYDAILRTIGNFMDEKA